MKKPASLSTIELLRRTLMVYVVIFILWGLYRLLFRFPIGIEELLFKPLVFLPPVLSVLVGEGMNVHQALSVFGLRRRGLALSIYYGLTLGVVFFLAVRLGGFVSVRAPFRFGVPVAASGVLSISLISLATAIWEQIVFSGFMLSRFQQVTHDEWGSATFTAVLFTLLHLPILLLESSVSFVSVAIELLLFFLVGFGNSVLMLRTRNIVAPVLSHTFWAMAVGLFS